MIDLFSPVSAPAGKSGGIPCSRCGRLCVIKGGGHPDALLLARATTKTKKGVCATCGFRSFVRDTPMEDIFGSYAMASPEALKLPHIQEMIRNLLKVGNAGVSIEEIDFDHLIETWSLPLK